MPPLIFMKLDSFHRNHNNFRRLRRATIHGARLTAPTLYMLYSRTSALCGARMLATITRC